jgi:RNA recognition motif-containing protein
MEKKKLFLGNLKYHTTQSEIEELISPFGTIVSIRLFEDKGFGFVEMQSEEESEKVISELNGKDFGGRTLKIDFALPPKN